MNIYRVFSDKVSEGQFPEYEVNSVTVIAETPSQAHRLVESRYKDRFVCEQPERDIVLVVEDVSEPAIVNVGYCKGSY